MKYPDDFINKIICGDCLEIVKQIPDKSIDLVLTDPPYGLEYEEQEWDKIVFSKLIKKIIREYLRILKDKCFAFIYVPKKRLYELKFLIKEDFEIFIEYRDWGQLRNNYLIFNCWVPILAIKKGKPKDRGKRPKNIIFSSSANTSKNEGDFRRYEHVTPKNLEVMKYLIKNFSDENDLILDPFLGSGTTAVASQQLHRNYIGIEISPKYCEIAKQRLRQKVLI